MLFYVPYKYFCMNDDVIKWKLFLRYWPFVWGCHRVSVNSIHKGQWHGTLMFSLICAWTNGCANNRDAGYLRRHRAHYGVTVMDNCYQVPLEWWSWETKHSFVFDATAAWAMASIKWAGEYQGLILLTCIKFDPCISNHVSIIVWDGITNTFLNFTGWTININFDNCLVHFIHKLCLIQTVTWIFYIFTTWHQQTTVVKFQWYIKMYFPYRSRRKWTSNLSCFKPWIVHIAEACRPGARPINKISIEFAMRPKSAVLRYKMYSTDHSEILHTPRQLHYRDLCMITLWSVDDNSN